MQNKYFVGVAFAALLMPCAAFAQSTGSTDFEGGEDIIVTGQRQVDQVAGIGVQDAPKTRVTVTSELIGRQRPGQTVNEIINLVPGVSFQSNDATGAAGGTFTIRGFDSSRISQTQDGIPLNDTGNYAIFTNQQQDPETLDSVTVNLGTTDVDSPTASAVGGTVNIRTRIPGETLGAMASATYGGYVADKAGEREIFRVFGMLDTGNLTSFGTRAFVSASNINARQPFNNYGKLQKQQYNARLYQPLGDNGDFLSIAGNYNQNRNNFFGSVPLRTDASATRIVGPNGANRFPLSRDERFYNINFPCRTDVPQAGVADTLAPAPAAPTAGTSCGTEFDRRYNPSNTGNIRGNGRFSLTDKLTLTVDPSFQYVKANGGGTVTGLEQTATLSGGRGAGYVGVLNTGTNSGNAVVSGFGYYTGVDLNGDGDLLDQVVLVAPSQTTTRRYGVISSLAYEISDTNRVRLTYTFDRGRHRQTGEAGFVTVDGEPFDVFPVNDPINGANGTPIQKRDRLSYATLNQISGEYRGSFADETLKVTLGVRAPFFKRDLNQACFTIAPNGNVACVAPSQVTAYGAANPYTYTAATNVVTGFAGPQSRVYKYSKVLPNVGATYNLSRNASVYASFAQGLSVPSTDNLYNAFYYPQGTENARPKPETTDSFDLGVRYNTNKITAQIAGFYTRFKNRIASTYDPEIDQSIFRNLGTVNKYGVDGSVAYSPAKELTLYVFGSYLGSEIKNDITAGEIGTTQLAYQTGGKREGGAPKFTYGGRVQGSIGLFDLGVQAKHTGARFINDENLPIFACSVGTIGGFCPIAGNVPAASVNAAAVQSQIYSAKAPGYTIVDLDIRLNLAPYGLKKTFFQLNVGNVFDEFYVGGISGSNGFVGVGNRYAIPNVVIGTPRSITGSIVVAF